MTMQRTVRAFRPGVLVLALGTLAAVGGAGFGWRERHPAPALAPDPEAAPAASVTAATGSDPLLAQMQNLGFQMPQRTVAAVDFSLQDVAGDPYSLDTYRDSVVFLNFWATWCAPCRTEMPAMQRLHDSLAGTPGFAVVAVNLQEQAAVVEQFVQELGLTFPVLLDSDGSTAATYGARTLPMSYVIDKDGSILARAIGIRSWDDPAYTRLFAALAGRER